MLEYPKIETLYDRDAKTFKIVPGMLRCPEFALVSRWLVMEKIDGCNIRVSLKPDGSVFHGGRIDTAQLHPSLVAWLQRHLCASLVAGAFDPGAEAILFGEGYGAGIQKGGGYRATPAFRLFDVAVKGEDSWWWLNWPSVEDIAGKLSVPTVPVLTRALPLIEAPLLLGAPSLVAAEEGGSGCEQEGIVARTEPLLLLRDGVRRLMWKLKAKDLSRAALIAARQGNLGGYG